MKSWAIEPEAGHMSYKVMAAGAPEPTSNIIPCNRWVVWIMEGGGGGETMNINVRPGQRVVQELDVEPCSQGI